MHIQIKKTTFNWKHFAPRTNFIQIWLVVSCYVLVGSRHKFKGDFAIKLKQIEGLMEDWIECQISPLVKYCQNITKYLYLCTNTVNFCFQDWWPDIKTGLSLN